MSAGQKQTPDLYFWTNTELNISAINVRGLKTNSRQFFCFCFSTDFPMICLIKTGVNFRKISVEKDEGDSEENGRPKELCFEDFKGRFGLRRGRNRGVAPGYFRR